MHLDLLTLVAMESFVAAAAGAALLVAWSQSRKVPALALWGLAYVIEGAGILGLALGSALHQRAWLIPTGSILALATGLVWKAGRSLDGRHAPLVLALLGAAVVGLASAIPGVREVAGSPNLVVGPAYLFATAASLWCNRKPRLAARWPIIILVTLHAVVLLIGMYSRIDGAIGNGNLAPVISLFGLIHFESIVFTLGTAVFVLALVKERNEAASKMAARVDPLTGIRNRSSFTEAAARIVDRCRREGAPVSVMMFDLDWFKTINDTHGHALGDAVLMKFCDVVAAALRPADVFGRIGGEEFAVALPACSIEAACARAERIRLLFAERCSLVEDHQVDATVSCGVSASVDAEDTLATLLARSDGALYGAKAEGRNRVKREDRFRPQGVAAAVIRVA